MSSRIAHNIAILWYFYVTTAIPDCIACIGCFYGRLPGNANLPIGISVPILPIFRIRDIRVIRGSDHLCNHPNPIACSVSRHIKGNSIM